MYEAEITFDILSDDEFTWYATYSTLQGAVDYIQRESRGRGHVRAFINNVRVEVQNGYVLGDDGEPFCTNEAWHEIFAKPHERVLPRIPTNPATYAAKGAPL